MKRSIYEERRNMNELAATAGWTILFLCVAFILAVMYPKAAFTVVDTLGSILTKIMFY